MNTLDKIRKPVHNHCFGLEIECLSDRDLLGKYHGFWYAGLDGSIERQGSLNTGVEFVSQPLPYDMLRKQVDHLTKKVGAWEYNRSCGIHVHVSKAGVSIKRLERFARGISENITNGYQQLKLFGRTETFYAMNRFNIDGRRQYINMTNPNTVEFRMFSSGDAEWAKECLRRTKLMCEYKGKVTYENLIKLFNLTEN